MKATAYCMILFTIFNLFFARVNSQTLLPNDVEGGYNCNAKSSEADSCILEEVKIVDSTLLFLVEQTMENDKKCPYYDDVNNVISIDIYGVKDSIGNVLNEEYKIQISIWDKSIVLSARINDFKYYYFKSKNFNGIIQACVNPPSNWFKPTYQSTVLYYSNDSPLMDDDSHSLYEYWFINHRFYVGNHYDCK